MKDYLDEEIIRGRKNGLFRELPKYALIASFALGVAFGGGACDYFRSNAREYTVHRPRIRPEISFKQDPEVISELVKNIRKDAQKNDSSIVKH